MDRSTVVLGLGALGLAGLVAWALRHEKRRSLGDPYQIEQTAKFLAKTYGITPEDARKLAASPQRKKIEREIEDLRARYSYPESNSPVVRHFVRDRVRALAGSGLERPTDM